MKIRGVASVIKANSAEEALEEVKLDPYYTQGIWDPSTVCMQFLLRDLQDPNSNSLFFRSRFSREAPNYQD
jgi:hypothetical protein